MTLEAELIVKFLEFANTNSDNYALAKQLDLDGPLQDMIKPYRNKKGSNNLDQILNSLFVKIIQIRSSGEDYKQGFRQIVQDVIGSKNEEQFIEDMEDVTDTIVEILNEKEIIKNNIELFVAIETNKEALQAIADVRSVSTNYSEKAKNFKDQTEAINLVGRAINNIESIDKQAASQLPSLEKEKLKKDLQQLKLKIDKLLCEGV